MCDSNLSTDHTHICNLLKKRWLSLKKTVHPNTYYRGSVLQFITMLKNEIDHRKRFWNLEKTGNTGKNCSKLYCGNNMWLCVLGIEVDYPHFTFWNP